MKVANDEGNDEKGDEMRMNDSDAKNMQDEERQNS